MGLLCARELSLAGLPVSMIDNGAIGAASWAGAGVLSPLHPWRYPNAVNALAEWGQENYSTLARDLKAKCGVDVEWERCGMLVMDSEHDVGAREWCHSRPECRYMGVGELRDRVPDARDFDGGWWLPHVAQVRNPRLLRALKQDLQNRGARIETRTVTRIVVEDGRLVGLQFGKITVQSHCCVITAGAWASGLLSENTLASKIYPVKGQILLLKAKHRLFGPILVKSDYYLVPRRDGRVLVGSTVENSQFEASVTEMARAELWGVALKLIPTLSDAQIEAQWAGLRPATPDGIPYIGEHPGIRGLYLCTGHYRNGLTMAPASARLVADLILGRSPILDPKPYSPGRVS